MTPSACWTISNWIAQTARVFCLLAALLAPASLRAADTNLVANGSFELGPPGRPEAWACAGNPAVKQQLSIDVGRDGRRCAKLVCSEFAGDGPDYHVMLCQAGRMSVRHGQWYRLTFWAKAAGLKAGSVDVGLSNTRHWENAGLSEAFTPGADWQKFSILFRAKIDLPAAESRLQFWFKGLGTLWMDDVVLAESAEGQQWFPQLSTEGCKNFVPNSSFECGAANWGSFTYGLSGWAGSLYRLEGQVDTTVAQHGRGSLKISIGPGTLPVYFFDYYDPVRQPVRRVLAANHGWFRVKPGEKLTLSAWLRADAEGVAAQLAANEAPSRLHRKEVRVGREWQRHEFTFTATEPYLFIALGLDLEASGREAATLWIDAVQLQRGEHATAYEPRQALESFLETSATGNILTNTKAGLSFTLRAWNDSGAIQKARGRFGLTDFFDRTVVSAEHELDVPPHAGAVRDLTGLCPDQTGFFRATWAPRDAASDAPQPIRSTLRCAVIAPARAGMTDSPLGFNHAYPWDFLVASAQQAGVVWWRDWSAKWQTVEPQKGRFDFSIPDAQIQRVLGLGGQVEVLLPFPSAAWCTTARPAEVEAAARGNDYLLKRLPLSYAPKDENDFGNYAAAVARHYVGGARGAVTHFQVLNEPIYTSYALSHQFGYTLADYLRLLEIAAGAIHGADPRCRVVGGISANLDAGLTRDFVIQGGLRSVDVFDLHMYNPPRPAEGYEESFRSLEMLMREHGGPKPVWITEWGCYADDDPPCLPPAVGDEAMSRCYWPSERAAAEHIVKFTAISFAHGVRKIFFHAGTCGAINGPDAGGVLFEYDGAPRKMYAAAATLTRILGMPEQCLRQWHSQGFHACLFRTAGKPVAVAWCEPGHSRTIKLESGFEIFDVMGNRLPRGDVLLEQSPVYCVGTKVEAALESLDRNTQDGHSER